MTAGCPECRSDVAPQSEPRLSEILVCDDCSTELEVVSLTPLMLALAPEVEEDWGE